MELGVGEARPGPAAQVGAGRTMGETSTVRGSVGPDSFKLSLKKIIKPHHKKFPVDLRVPIVNLPYGSPELWIPCLLPVTQILQWSPSSWGAALSMSTQKHQHELWWRVPDTWGVGVRGHAQAQAGPYQLWLLLGTPELYPDSVGRQGWGRERARR